ncbi:MAG: DUF2461 family protein [Nostoc sp.]|uniref:DUF2461 family protein n=1 Tax=Nostoc sp. TaxID=1180 RepID=UPI002FF69720
MYQSVPTAFPLPQPTFQFLQALAENNSKTWFDEQRQRYQFEVVTPIRNLIESLAPFLTKLNPDLDVSYRVNTTVMRINRDRRFAPTSPPYRTYIKVSFPIRGRKWSEDPVFGFGIFPNYFYVAFRNAGKERKSFIQQYAHNLTAHQQLFEQWLECCQVSQKLAFLGGEHDAIEVLSPCSPAFEDWRQHLEPTVGQVWTWEKLRQAEGLSLNQVVDLLVRLYFLKLMALSDNLEQDADHYFTVARELCSSSI